MSTLLLTSALPPRPGPEYGGSPDVPGGLWDSAAVTEPDQYCRKRVRGIGAVSTSEETIPRSPPSLQQRLSNCGGRPELDSVRSPYHQYQDRLFQQYRPQGDSVSAVQLPFFINGP